MVVAANVEERIEVDLERRSQRQLVDEPPDIDGVAEHWGRDVIHCPFCHGFEVRDLRIVQIVTHPMGLHAAGLFRRLTAQFTVVLQDLGEVDHAEVQALRASGVDIVLGPVTRVVTGADGHVAAVELAGNGRIDADAVAVGPRYRVRAERSRRSVSDPRRTRPGWEISWRPMRPAPPRCRASLRADGVIVSRQGSGSVVHSASRAVASSRIAEHFTEWPGIDLAAGNPPDPSHWPPISLTVAELIADGGGPGVQPLGLEALRAGLAAGHTAAGRLTDVAQVHVTAGAHHALALLAGACMSPGDTMAVEETSYPGIFDFIESVGCRPIPLATDGAGILPDALERALGEQRPKILSPTWRSWPSAGRPR